MFVARFLLGSWLGRAALLAAVALVAYVATVQPSWAVDPLRSVAERALEFAGAGFITAGLWLLAFLFLLLTKPFQLLRRWRWFLGTGFLAVAVQGTLTYFEAGLPLIGATQLGGEIGLEVRGSTGAIGVARVAVSALVGAWLLAPALAKKLFRRASRSAGMTAEGSARAYGRIPVHRGLGRLVGKGLGTAVVAGKKGVESRRSRSLRKDLGKAFGKDDGRGTDDAPGLDLGGLDLDGDLEDEPSFGIDEALGIEAAPELEPEIEPEPEPRKRARQAQEKPKSQPIPAVAKVRPWKMPEMKLLRTGAIAGAVTQEHHATAELIEESLGDHGVEVRVAEIRPGPTVTMFGLVPGWNRKRGPGRGRDGEGEPQQPEARGRVRVDAILAREKDLALALAAPSLRIEAPVPGESVVGVEVPNRSSSMVALRNVMESDEYQEMLKDDGLPVALGLATAGEPIAIDLRKMPHLLIAGATGSGKSVCINTVISSLIMHQDPSKVRLMLVDPKRVELTPYNGIPHLVTPVVVDPDRVVRLLRGAIQEMLRRYKLLEETGVRNIQSYHRSPRAKEPLPYFVICIDELADLMMTASFEVEQSLCRLAQLGRATGIHLIVATQRPSVDVVTGLIKANFPSRIAFAVASQVDSRTILDTAGAERLLGRGDMLFLSADAAKPKRVQGAYLTEEESERLVNHWVAQPAMELPEIALEELAAEAEAAAAIQGGGDFDENDSLFDRAVQLATANRQLSTSLLQRRLRIGYPRAARLMDQLEEDGVVAPASDPGKPREVLYRGPED